MKGVSVAEAFELMAEKTKGKSTLTIDESNFREMVETYYKEEQIYRNRNGGTSFEEFTAIAETEKKKYSDKQIRDGFIEYKTNELDTWNYAGIDEYFENKNLTPEEEDEERYSDGCFFIVPAKTDAEAFIHYLNDYDLVKDDHVEKVGRSVRNETDIITLFERLNNSRSPELRAVEKGSISFPVEARVYQLVYS